MHFTLVVTTLLSYSATILALRLAPLMPAGNDGEVIPNEYIVMLRDPAASISDFAERPSFLPDDMVDRHINEVFGQSFSASNAIMHKYDQGYAVRMTHEQMDALRSREDVDYIEPNMLWYVNPVEEEVYKQENWGLRRINTPDLPLSKTYNAEGLMGEGTDIYVVDTGINVDHVDFEGRAEWGLTAPYGDEDRDGNGHGTHVASTIGGVRFGVAKKAHLFAVKVLRSSGYGSTSDVLKGILWVGQQHSEKSKKNKNTKSIANMSLGGGKSNALDNAVDRVARSGVHFAVAAGNENQNACNSSPAAAPSAMTVGATTVSDSRAWFSNWGTCVDIFAPGHNICAAWHTSDTDIKCISGTSMASPHVAGVMALLAAEREPMAAADMKELIIDMGGKNKITDVRGSPNVLLFKGETNEELHMRNFRNVQSYFRALIYRRIDF